MYINSTTKVFLVLLSFSFASHVAYNFYKRRKNKNNERKEEINEVIMFAYGMCELQKSKYSRCMITESMERVLYYLSIPKHTIDICIYVFTNVDILNAIIKLHYKGVKIRLIIDADMAFSSGSVIKRMEKLGIPVRWMKSTNLMHHKFCLIDINNDKVTPFVMAGSLNWTNQALCGNWEDVIVTSQIDIVQQYTIEFERLWTYFKPIVN